MKLAVLDDYLNVLADLIDWSVLPSDVEVDIFQDNLMEIDAVAERLRDYDAIICMRERTPFPAALLGQLPNLKLLVTLGSNNPSFDFEECTRRGIVISGTGSSSVDPVELTWALILSAARNLPHEDRSVRLGKWQSRLGTRLSGKTLGVLGLGRIGRQVAQIGPAFGMDVIAWSENLTDAKAGEVGAKLVSKDDILRRSDFLSVNLRLGPRTRGLIGKRELEQMKPTAFLVNTARSRIIQEEALIEALQKRRIAGAALDVFDQEPLPKDHPFMRLDNVILSPHLGGVTDGRYRDDYTQAIEGVLAWRAGSPVRVLNPGVL